MNAAKHAEASTASLTVRPINGHLLLTVEDDGRGITSSEDVGIGLWLMRERSERLGGSVTVANSGSGTTVTARLPLGDDG